MQIDIIAQEPEPEMSWTITKFETNTFKHKHEIQIFISHIDKHKTLTAYRVVPGGE